MRIIREGHRLSHIYPDDIVIPRLVLSMYAEINRAQTQRCAVDWDTIARSDPRAQVSPLYRRGRETPSKYQDDGMNALVLIYRNSSFIV